MHCYEKEERQTKLKEVIKQQPYYKRFETAIYN